MSTNIERLFAFETDVSHWIRLVGTCIEKAAGEVLGGMTE
jgi:hypothetical protein